MTWQLVSLADVPPSRWKNGGGITRELVAWPSVTDWRWRMSVAEVAQSGPFSRFDGVQRWCAVLSGAGVRLNLGLPPVEQVHTLTPGSAALCFDGAAPVRCTLLDGPTQDFNLMLRPGQAGVRLRRVTGDDSMHLDTTKIIAVYAIDTGATVHFYHEVLTLAPNTLAWRTCPAGTVLQLHSAHALCVEMAA